MSQVDVADFLGVTESRISNLVTARIRPAIAAAHVVAEVADLYRDDHEYSKLVVDWIRL